MIEEKKPVGHLVLLSGGADSATVLGYVDRQYQLELQNGFDTRIIALHTNYGQRTEQQELNSFHALCDHYDIDTENRYVVDIKHLAAIGGSSLTDDNIEVADNGDSIKRKYVPSSYVPFRNGNILSIAASIACVRDITDIWCGVVQEDSSGYPDCRTEFIGNMEAAINTGLPDGRDIVMHAPLINFSKDQIIEAGFNYEVPYHLTWSCYQGEGEACGVCDSCRLRVASFVKLGKQDPIPYAIGWEAAVEKAAEVIEGLSVNAEES